MPIKRVLILANSVKKQNFCVAGREMMLDERDNRVGAWVRPISRQDEGALLFDHCALQGGSPVSVLDIVDIPLQAHAGDVGQPENWLIHEPHASPWIKVAVFPSSAIPSLWEHPHDLWLEPRIKTDRISVNDQAGRRTRTSLVMIKPQRLRIRLWTEHNRFKQRDQKKTRALFSYCGAEYDLSITDRFFHPAAHPAVGRPPIEYPPPFGDHCLLCVSLTPPFNGYHYKVVATILKMP